MFGVTWNKSFICCACGERKGEAESHKAYKKICICKECNESLPRVENFGTFPGLKKLDFVISPFYYKEPYRTIFLKYKFNGDYASGTILGHLTADYVEQLEDLSQFDYMSVIPLSRQRMNERGYNQSQIIAEVISERTGIEIRNVLKRDSHKTAQSKLSGYERMTNIKGIFSVTEDVMGKNILLFDDVCTTGSTMEECAAVLKQNGAVSVGAVAGAYVYRDYSRNRDAYIVVRGKNKR